MVQEERGTQSLPARSQHSGNSQYRGSGNFRANAAFVGLMIIVFFTVIHLMQLLKSILEPLLWAIFLVMAIRPLTVRIERVLLRLCEPRGSGARSDDDVWDRNPSDVAIEGTVFGSAEESGKEVTPRGRSPVQESADDHDDAHPLTSDVQDLREARPVNDRDSKVRHQWRSDAARKRCFLSLIAWRGCWETMARCIAVLAALMIVLGITTGFCLILFESALHMQKNFSVYELGARNFAKRTEGIVSSFFGHLPKGLVDEVAKNALEGLKGMISEVVGAVFSHIGQSLIEVAMMTLYVLFWLCTPMPLSGQTEEMFRRYILMKSAACLGYGVCVGFTLYWFSIDLWSVFGLISFLFNFVPEVGVFIAMVLPVPVILFDSRLKSPFLTLLLSTAAQLGLKFLFGNIIEVKLVESDESMKMHPVIILLAVAFFGYIWGPTGMLLSVPIMAYLKASLFSDFVPDSYRDPILIFLEGDRSAPARVSSRRSSIALD